MCLPTLLFYAAPCGEAVKGNQCEDGLEKSAPQPSSPAAPALQANDSPLGGGRV